MPELASAAARIEHSAAGVAELVVPIKASPYSVQIEIAADKDFKSKVHAETIRNPLVPGELTIALSPDLRVNEVFYRLIVSDGNHTDYSDVFSIQVPSH
jgi:hypothetical protein